MNLEPITAGEITQTGLFWLMLRHLQENETKKTIKTCFLFNWHYNSVKSQFDVTSKCSQPCAADPLISTPSGSGGKLFSTITCWGNLLERKPKKTFGSPWHMAGHRCSSTHHCMVSICNELCPSNCFQSHLGLEWQPIKRSTWPLPATFCELNSNK